ncbi:MAG TPA: 3-dehydroquinate synthase [Desulfobulbaceae bacterium]|nr:3-dehydroquinate synthase [Desulfobulbaceae bacterium]
MAELRVRLAANGYPIEIAHGCLDNCGKKIAALCPAKKYAVIADSTVATLYAPALLASLDKTGLTAHLFLIQPGETQKNLATIGELAERLAVAGFDRHDALIALGGGVAGDICGFLASIYMRGIPFVQVPTTLLAQVDSSVGGKTGVDIEAGKNLVGTFHQPKAVFIDPETLSSLPPEELRSGLAEVLKYGLIRDSAFFDFLAVKREDIFRLDPTTLIDMITNCCRIKADVVMADEREGGLRRILNFGHTFGHAVEAASNYSLSHGFAVSIGMMAATRLSERRGLLTPAERNKIHTVLTDYGLPVDIPPQLAQERIRSFLKTDKKAVAGRLVFVLLNGIGQAEMYDDISEEEIATLFNQPKHSS